MASVIGVLLLSAERDVLPVDIALILITELTNIAVISGIFELNLEFVVVSLFAVTALFNGLIVDISSIVMKWDSMPEVSDKSMKENNLLAILW